MGRIGQEESWRAETDKISGRQSSSDRGRFDSTSANLVDSRYVNDYRCKDVRD